MNSHLSLSRGYARSALSLPELSATNWFNSFRDKSVHPPVTFLLTCHNHLNTVSRHLPSTDASTSMSLLLYIILLIFKDQSKHGSVFVFSFAPLFNLTISAWKHFNMLISLHNIIVQINNYLLSKAAVAKTNNWLPKALLEAEFTLQLQPGFSLFCGDVTFFSFRHDHATCWSSFMYLPLKLHP